MSRERILVVDDEPQILRFLKPSLTAAGYDVITADTAAAALKSVAASAPDIIILDLGLPDRDGKDVIRELRLWSAIPVIVLSARDREAEKIAALDIGADDYINKPFGMGELMARVRTALRHRERAGREIARVAVGPLTVDLDARTVSLAEKSVRLTRKEFDLLALLARNAGRVVTHRQILTAVWGPAHAEDLQYLRVFIGQIRQKLESAGARQLIHTESGIGYRLLAEET